MATRLDKSKMACNKPRKSPKADKKKVVKACQVVLKKLFILAILHTAITTALLRENLLERAINAVPLKIN